MADANINPMANVYKNFLEILQNITIKYSYIAEENEKNEAKQKGDEYLDSYLKRDNFLSYRDYLYEDYITVGISDAEIISKSMAGDIEAVPDKYREPLLELRRARVLANYEELNNYYRMLNGYPNLKVNPDDETKLDMDENDRYYIDPMDLFYVPEELANKYNVPELYTDRIPIHYIQDYYNKIEPTRGDSYVSLLEGIGYIRDLYAANPDMTYLKYFGSSRIPVVTSRSAKNFQILQLKWGNIKYLLYNQFTQIYEQCRQYFMDVIFIREFRSFIDNYDRFIAMCIMVMTLQQVVMKQLQLTVNREFFDAYAVRMLYQAYGVPYNLNLDDETQARIAQNLNMFIQAKATDQGLYNIAEVLGFTNNFNIYKYYLSKEHKLDQYGVPIIKYHEVFNNDTGEVEIKPDYEEMYNLYFHREELKKQNFINSFNEAVNNSNYKEITDADPFWIKDSNLNRMVYETEYNFVESKYLGIAISYKLTDLMYENIMLLKSVIKKQDEIKDLKVTLPKITGEIQIPIFDIIIAMICLTSAKHNLTGEILSLPTDILSYLDYMTNIDASEDYLVDTFSFNFDYFLEPDWEKSWWLNKKALKVVSDDISDEDFNPQKMVKISDVTSKLPDIQLGDYVIDKMTRLYQFLSEDEINEIKSFINIITIPEEYTTEQRQEAFNELLSDIKAFQKFISFKMTETKDIRVYRRLRDLARTIFYTKEVRDIFNLNLGTTTRTAHNYFEYLYYKNPVLYSAMFETNTEEQYKDFISKKGQYQRLLDSKQLQYLRYYHIYCEEHGLSEDTFTIDDYKETYTYWNFTDDINTQKIIPLMTKNYTLADFNADIKKGYVTYYTDKDISYEEFMDAANAGEFIDDNDVHYPIYIKYDYIANSKVDNVDIKDEKVYFYLNHMISRLEVLIDNINYLYMLSDATTPLQELLVKFVKFFKSYTTELISFENIVIVDLIPENMMKMMDVVHHIWKLIQTREHYHIAYSDVIHAIINLYVNDKLTFTERYIDCARIVVDENWGISNSVRLKDVIYDFLKEILLKDKSFDMYDVIHSLTETFMVVDNKPTEERKSMFRETVMLYYENEEGA